MFAKSLTKSGVILKHTNMKSRITIDVDYDNQPCILIDYQESDDVRDKLVKRFLEGFGGESVFAHFQYTAQGSTFQANRFSRVRAMGLQEALGIADSFKDEVKTEQNNE